MKHLGLWLGISALALAGLAGPAFADTIVNAVVPGACGAMSYATGSARAVTQSAGGQLCVFTPVYTSTGFVAVGSFSTATGFTPPTGSTVCFIQAEGNSVRFRTDGTNPTSSTGQLLATGQVLTETANLAGIKFIPTTGNATLDVDCYR